MGEHVLLVGMMGSGKSTVGRIVADRMRRPFRDSDADVERRTGKSVPAIFAARGEPAYRAEERAVLCAALASLVPSVIAVAGGAVIDPDSRLTQLGLIRVCDDANYFFFESRRYGGEGLDRLPDLASRWAREVFGVADAGPYIAPQPVTGPPAEITVSLGVGENASKRIIRGNSEGEFECELLGLLAGTGATVLVDKGAGAEERARVEAALQPGMRTHDGAFAPFAAEIARSKLFVGYDSAGGHVASACGVPLISIANGFASERMLARWRPNGTVIRGDRPDVLGAIREALLQ